MISKRRLCRLITFQTILTFRTLGTFGTYILPILTACCLIHIFYNS